MTKGYNPYRVFRKYYLRTPLFSISNYNEFIGKEELCFEDFKAILNNDLMREAIYLASPNLLNQLEKWEKGLIQNPKKVDKLKISILKYFTRISSRSTPFGLFASCNLGNFGKETKITLDEVDKFSRETSLDFLLLDELASVLLKDETVLKKTLFYPNNSIYEIGNHYRYFEYSLENFKRKYSLEGLDYSIFLKKTLEKSTRGATIDELTENLLGRDITIEDATNYIKELIQNQILVSEIDLNTVGGEHLYRILKSIEDNDSRVYKELHQLRLKLKNLDNGFNKNVEKYLKIENYINNLIGNNNQRYVFKVNVFSSLKNNILNKKLMKDFRKALNILNKITLHSANDRLEYFKINFLRRYNDNRVPLSLALDPDIGIRYGERGGEKSNFLDDVAFEKNDKGYKRIIWSDFDSLLQEKLITCTSKNKYSIKLKEEDFKKFPIDWSDLPDTFSSVIELYKTDSDFKIFMNHAGGSSAVNLLGRFANGDGELLKFVKRISKIEKKLNEGKLIAEINHLPQVRTGNILHRPLFREFEIPFLVNSYSNVENQIKIKDILVSVEGKRIKLFSIKHQKEIIPRLGNAHLYDSPELLSIYTFLCDLQTQNLRSGVGFSWNTTFLELTFLPRVEFNNFIFSKARWNFKTNLLSEIIESDNILILMNEFRRKYLVPEYVELVQGDRRLLVCLKNKTSIEMLYQVIKSSERFILEEFLFSNDEFVKRKEESFCNELIISFYNQEKLNLVD